MIPVLNSMRAHRKPTHSPRDHFVLTKRLVRTGVPAHLGMRDTGIGNRRDLRLGAGCITVILFAGDGAFPETKMEAGKQNRCEMIVVVGET